MNLLIFQSFLKIILTFYTFYIYHPIIGGHTKCSRENHFYFVAVDIRTDSNADISGFVREANAYSMVVGVIQSSKWIHHGSIWRVGCWMQFYEAK